MDLLPNLSRIIFIDVLATSSTEDKERARGKDDADDNRFSISSPIPLQVFVSEVSNGCKWKIYLSVS